ncbi:MAG: hypothetical protein ACRC1K_03970 [Planctomycetia bacterium]
MRSLFAILLTAGSLAAAGCHTCDVCDDCGPPYADTVHSSHKAGCSTCGHNPVVAPYYGAAVKQTPAVAAPVQMSTAPTTRVVR